MRSKIKLGIIFDQVVSSGGGYCQSLNALKVIKKLHKKNDFDIQIYILDKTSFEYIKNNLTNAHFLKLSFIHKVLLNIKSNPKFEFVYSFLKIFYSFNIFEKIMLKERVDLVYFLSPSRLINDIGSLNFIYTIWDNCHRDNPEFPEIRDFNQFEQREYYLKNLSKAFAILTDSNLGKNNLIKRYGIDEDRISVIPFEPYSKPSIKSFNKNNFKKYSKLKPYIFYPAQYWPHKNHVYIIEAIKYLENKCGKNINAVFTGYDKGNLCYLKNYSKKLFLDNKIFFMDFLNELDISYLYQNCLAVVMPTYFGPTNIPPLEAFQHKVPLIYSDLPGMREQVEDAALFVNLEDPISLAKEILNLLNDNDLRKNIIKNGTKILKINESFDRQEAILSIINKFKYKKKCWD